ncbi:hypothetical protein OIU79_012576 [Salix purpurea]|uniref:Uncharacterized protein n=1 Tax=Salix purpurea TaxID=77065 RepID=A0A9Q0Q407_SALPP|nr:hypothetical protein OIU79_012576 [Salix purpurea]
MWLEQPDKLYCIFASYSHQCIVFCTCRKVIVKRDTYHQSYCATKSHSTCHSKIQMISKLRRPQNWMARDSFFKTHTLSYTTGVASTTFS